MIRTGTIRACEFHSGSSRWLPPWGDPRKSRSGTPPPEPLERLAILEVVGGGLGHGRQLARLLEQGAFALVAVLDRLGHVGDAVARAVTRPSPVLTFHQH